MYAAVWMQILNFDLHVWPVMVTLSTCIRDALLIIICIVTCLFLSALSNVSIILFFPPSGPSIHIHFHMPSTVGPTHFFLSILCTFYFVVRIVHIFAPFLAKGAKWQRQNICIKFEQTLPVIDWLQVCLYSKLCLTYNMNLYSPVWKDIIIIYINVFGHTFVTCFLLPR